LLHPSFVHEVTRPEAAGHFTLLWRCKHLKECAECQKIEREQMAVCQNLVPLVNVKIAGKWMFIPLKMVLIGIDPYPDMNKSCWGVWKLKPPRKKAPRAPCFMCPRVDNWSFALLYLPRNTQVQVLFPTSFGVVA
jgi:hypothetical protein